MAYYSKEIPEWTNSDLISYFNTNNLRSIASKVQNNLLTGYDLFYLSLKDLKHEIGITDYHDRLFTYREIRKLTIICEEDNLVIKLDNDMKVQLAQLLNCIGSYFHIEINDIIIKDATNADVISPSVQIVELMIVSPEKYKTLHITKVKNRKQLITPLKNNNNNNNNNSNSAIDQYSSNAIGKQNNNKYDSKEDNSNINYGSNYFSNNNNNGLNQPNTIPMGMASKTNRDRNSFVKGPKQINSLIGPNNNSHNSNGPNAFNNNYIKNNSLLSNNTPNRNSNNNIPSQQTTMNTNNNNNNKYTSTTYATNNNDLLSDPIDTNSSNNHNYFLNPNNTETTKLPIPKSANNNSNITNTNTNINTKTQRSLKDQQDKHTLNIKDTPVEVRYKSEKRIYRQHDPNTDANTITANLLKSNNYLGTENSIENDEFLFYNNVNKKTNSNSTPNIVNYSENSNNLNYTNRQLKQKQKPYSNYNSFKQQRTFNEDFIEDNDYCSNNEFS